MRKSFVNGEIVHGNVEFPEGSGAHLLPGPARVPVGFQVSREMGELTKELDVLKVPWRESEWSTQPAIFCCWGMGMAYQKQNLELRKIRKST